MTEDAIVAEAFAKPSTERAAYLDVACAGQPNLRATVEARLAVLQATLTVAPDIEATGDFTPAPRLKPTTTANDVGLVIAGRYTLESVIGEGGMGSVYRASQTEPVKRHVALKLIKAGLDSKNVLGRFDAERQALALMDHPNIARIYDGGVAEQGQPFFVMELVQGVPLTEYCDAKRLSVVARLQLFVQICHAIQHAHQKGIIHRDLKPGNVLVTEVDGRPTPKVIDFGVAKATEQKLTDLSFADVGAIVGTPAYMSPEQADPTSMDIDTRSDVYALGVILYELLTGSPPIDTKQFKRGALLEMLRMVREVEAPRPSTKLSTAESLPNIAANRNMEPAKLAKLLQGELDWVVLKALEKDRSRRYDSANSFAADVQRYLADEVVLAKPPSRGYRLRKFVKRNKVQVLAASFVVVALVAGIIGTTLGLFEARKQEAHAKGETLKKSAALKHAEVQELLAKEETRQKRVALVEEERQRRLAADRLEETRYREALDTILLAQAAYEANNVKLALARLEQVAVEFRRWEWHYLRQHFTGGLYTIYGHQGAVVDLAYSPDGTKLLSVGEERTAYVWDAVRGQRLRVLERDGARHDCVAYSPDGKSLATAGSHLATVWDAATGKALFDLQGNASKATRIVYSPDATRLATAHEDGRLRLWNATTGVLERELSGHMNEEAAAFQNQAKALGLPSPPVMVRTTVAFSPDGQRLLSAATRTARVWDVRTGKPLFDLRGHATAMNSVAYSPDGLYCLTCSTIGGNSRILLWDARNGALLREIQSKEVLQNIVISPDGQYLAASRENGLRLWEIRTGAVYRDYHGHTALIGRIAFRADGAVVATAGGDQTIKVWDVRGGQGPLPLMQTTGGIPLPVECVAHHPTASLVATSQRTNGVHIWDTTTRQVKQTLAQPRAQRVAYRPDGQQVATGGSDRAVKIWDASTGVFQRDITGHKGPVTCLAYTMDGNKLLIAAEDNQARVYDSQTGKLVHTLPHRGVCQWITSNATGRVLATSDGQFGANRVCLWDADAGTLTRSLTAETLGTFHVVALDRDATRVYAASSDTSIYVWDAATGKVLQRFNGHSDSVISMALSPDGERLVSGGRDRVVLVWDTKTGTQLLKLTGFEQGVATVSFDVTGQRLVVGAFDGTMRVYDGQPQSQHPTLLTAEGVSCTAWHPTEALLATGGEHGTVIVWDTTTYRERYRFTMKGGRIDSLSFSPTGTQLMVAAGAKQFTLHDAATGVQQRVLHDSEMWVFGATQAVQFSRDGTKLVHTQILTDSEPLVLDVATGKQIPKAALPPLFLCSSIDPRGTTVALIRDNGVVLMPLAVAEVEKQRRTGVVQVALGFHWDEWQKARTSKQDFASQFHHAQFDRFAAEVTRLKAEASKQLTSSGLMNLRQFKVEEA